MCPYCTSRAIVARGRVLANATGIRADYRCSKCFKEFVVRSPKPLMFPPE